MSDKLSQAAEDFIRTASTGLKGCTVHRTDTKVTVTGQADDALEIWLLELARLPTAGQLTADHIPAKMRKIFK